MARPHSLNPSSLVTQANHHKSSFVLNHGWNGWAGGQRHSFAASLASRKCRLLVLVVGVGQAGLARNEIVLIMHTAHAAALIMISVLIGASFWAFGVQTDLTRNGEKLSNSQARCQTLWSHLVRSNSD